MPEEAKPYDPKAHEEALYAQWEASGAFQPQGAGKPFVIMMPPPNVTGNLHMGHALQNTVMDALIRYHRMLGDAALLVPGTDHAALPTNALIEKQLKAEGLSKEEIGREAFMKRVQAWYQQYGGIIQNQIKRLGTSCDWEHFMFTMDPPYVQAVLESFLRYYEKGYIYRGNRLVNWDPKTHTTVSDLETVWQKETIPFYTFQYGPFQISTARPETKFGDKYVVMHPSDERYAQYKHGDTFEAEWINGPVKATVIKDEAVDPAFGTGVMTITPWHDAVDFQIAQRHNLDVEQIIDFDGKLLPIAQEFAGMRIEDARPKIVEKLQAKGLVVSVNEKYEHNSARNERGNGVIEPQIMRQWFVKMDELKALTKKAVEAGDITFHGPRHKKKLLAWIAGEHDWTISRQIWLGQQIPVWWKPGVRGTDKENEAGNFVASFEKPASAPGSGEAQWEQDPDVVDTWFSSALWPIATLGWPQETDDLKKYYPTSVLTTAQEILELWVHRMIFSGLEFTGQVPFKDVIIHPTVLNKKGQRMSKSLGTGIDPLDLINQYGADATRFALLFQMSYDQQAIKFDEDVVKTARNFANKLWNIARFIQQMPEGDPVPMWAGVWTSERAHTVTRDVTTLLNEFKLGEAARILYDFVWNDFADWYIEVLKLYGSKANATAVFMTILKLLHPFMPFVTEVLWKQMGGEGLLIVASWPTTDEEQNPTEVMAQMERFQEVVKAIRSIRALLAISPKEKITVSIPEVADRVAVEALARCQVVATVSGQVWRFPLPSGSGVIEVDASSIAAELVNKARERLQKQISDTENVIAMSGKILTQMKDRATPEAVQEKEQALQTAQARLAELEQSLAALN